MLVVNYIMRSVSFLYPLTLLAGLMQITEEQVVFSEGEYQTHVSYRFVLNFTDSQTFQGDLYLGATHSLFRYALSSESWSGQDIVSDELLGDYSFKVLDSTTYFIASDRLQARVLHLEKVPGTSDLCLVTEDFPSIDWTYTGQSKKIQELKCYEAIGDFRGRRYTVWYADELAGNFGPWKFHGLPGLVLEAVDATGEVHFYAESIHPLRAIDQPDNPLSYGSYEVVDRQEYLHLLRRYLGRLEQRMTTRAGRGFQVTVKSSSIQSIEFYEE